MKIKILQHAAVLTATLLLMIGSFSSSSAEKLWNLSSVEWTAPVHFLEASSDAEKGSAGSVCLADPAGPVPETLPDIHVKGFIPNALKRAVIGADDRIQVNDTEKYPFSAIASMKVTLDCGHEWECSGFMIGKNFLLTAAHCVVCPTHSAHASHILFYFGYNSEGSYLYQYDGPWNAVTGTEFPSGYDFNAMSEDWCIIRLDQNVGEQTGWLDFSVASDSEIGSRRYLAAGYRDGKLKYASGTAEVYDPRLMTFDADQVQGNSGGPLLLSFADQDTVCSVDGIIIAENVDLQTNIGRRIDWNIWNSLLEAGYQ